VQKASKEVREMEKILEKIVAVDLTFFDLYASSGVASRRAEDPSIATLVKPASKGDIHSCFTRKNIIYSSKIHKYTLEMWTLGRIPSSVGSMV